jgi:hypothetical protein
MWRIAYFMISRAGKNPGSTGGIEKIDGTAEFTK